MKLDDDAGTSGALGSTRKRGPLPFVGVTVFLSLWVILSWSGLVNTLLLPSPLRVLQSITDVGPSLGLHVVATIGRIVIGYILGVAVGMSLGFAMQYNGVLFAILDGLIETFRPVPPVAVVPFFILVFGFSELGKIVIVALGTALVLVVATVEAIERIPSSTIRWGLVCNISRASLYKDIVLPAALPELRSGFRIAMALAITLVIVSEFMGATYGLGYLISVSKVTLTTPTLLLCIMLLGWIGWGLDRVVRMVFDRLCFWDVRAKGATL